MGLAYYWNNKTYNNKPLAEDGLFGAHSDAAVRYFQSYYGLTVDGKAGSQFWQKMESLLTAGSTSATATYYYPHSQNFH